MSSDSFICIVIWLGIGMFFKVKPACYEKILANLNMTELWLIVESVVLILILIF